MGNKGGGERRKLRGVDALYLVSALGFHEFVIDEEADGLVVFAAVGRGEGHEELGGHDGFGLIFLSFFLSFFLLLSHLLYILK